MLKTILFGISCLAILSVGIACEPTADQDSLVSAEQDLQVGTWLRLNTPNPGKLRAALQSSGLDVTGYR